MKGRATTSAGTEKRPGWAAYGMTEEDYRAMLYALRRFKPCERVVGVAHAEEGAG